MLDSVEVLPQAAKRLDVSLPIYDNEILIEVKKLNIDSASFRQLKESCRGDMAAIGDKILSLTRERGKMQNPITGSGGMLVGRVLQVGPKASQEFKIGDPIATLVSLTLTPLHLGKISRVDPLRGQVEVEGYAVLFASSVAARLPEDIPEDMALAVLDVCGAPAWVRKLLRPQEKILVLGTGKSGVLSAFAALENTERQNLWVSDVSEDALERALHSGLGARGFAADAQSPIRFLERLREAGAPDFDLVVNTCNAPETETASLLAAKSGGRVLFFNMATSFQRAVLSAEGLGRELELFMGNGYALGHAALALDLIRKHPGLRKFFEG